MAENSKIEWTDHTFNPWIGCQKVSPGCDNCYAEAMMDKRWGKVEWGPHGERKRTSEANWKLPLRWAKQANGRRPRVFCASLADVFDNQIPLHWRGELFNLIYDTPELDWLLLTKRPENIQSMLYAAIAHKGKQVLREDWPWPNVWLGTTAEDQNNYRRRWRLLCKIPAVVHFVSYEPAIGPLSPDILEVVPELPNWIICGGESGHGARMMNPQWARDLRDECAKFNIPFFMKQMTGKKPIPDDLMVRQFPSPANSDKNHA